MAPSLQIAILGAASLKGKELAAVLQDSSLAMSQLRLLEGEVAPPAGPGRESGAATLRLAAMGEEPAIVEPLTEATLAEADLIFLAAASREATALALRQPAGAALIDLTGQLAAEEGHLLWGPMAAHQTLSAAQRRRPLVVIPHPAAATLASLFAALAPAGAWRSAAATVLEPSSERGQAALSELQEQSLNLLSLRSIPTAVHGAQVAFNIRRALDEPAAPTLAAVEARILDELGHLWTETAELRETPPPAVQLLQAPIFHCHAISLWLENPDPLPLPTLERQLRQAGFALAEPGEADLRQSAGEDQAHLVLRRATPPAASGSGGESWWFFVTLDNLRLPARAAIEAALTLWRQREG